MNELKTLDKIVTMGVDGIGYVEEKVSNKDLLKTLLEAKKKYLIIKRDILEEMRTYGEESSNNILVKKINELYTNIELIKGNDSKIVKMLIEGTNKGIIKIEEILNTNPDKEIKNIATNLLNLLEYQINSWKSYL